MKTSSSHSNASYLGAATAFVLFLVTGLVPALVYGGYMGLMLSGVLFGHESSELLATRLVTGGGMLLGTIATLFLYVVAGAFVGNMIGAALRRFEPAPRGEPVEAEHDHAAH